MKHQTNTTTMVPASMDASRVKSRVEYIDASVASAWLSKNTRNRPLNSRLIKRITSQIRNGEWALNGESIVWGSDGILIDGQHRLLAIVEAGVASPGLPCVVVYGITPDAFKTVDSGQSRFAKDDLALLGYNNTALLASAAALLYVYKVHGTMLPAGVNRPTRSQTVETMLMEPGLAKARQAAEAIHRKMPNVFKTQTSVLYHLFGEIDPELNELFWNLLADGSNLDKNSPILILRNRITASFVGSHVRNSYAAAEFAALCIKGWNAWIAGQKIAQLRWKGNGKYSEDFPQISASVRVQPEAIA